VASTITRFAWTNDSGSHASPVGDGTTINNAELQKIFDAIDQMFGGAGSYTVFTLGGRLTVEGFGAHTFSSGGTGSQTLDVRNTTAGSTNYAGVNVGTNAAAAAGRLLCTSTTFTPTGYLRADALVMDSDRAGGISIAATHASGIVTLQTSGTERLRILSNGNVGLGSTTAGRALTIARTSAAADLQLVSSGGSGKTWGLISDTSGNFILQDDADGTPSLTIFAAGSFVFNGTGLLVPDGSASAPSLTFTNETTMGVYRIGTRLLGVAMEGVQIGKWQGGPTVGGNQLEAAPGAWGVGGKSGSGFYAGRNTSGSGAAGYVQFGLLSGSVRSIWVDGSGNLRIHTDFPLENGAVADTAGTVVGTQTSRRATKDLLGRFEGDALAYLRALPIWRFTYKTGSYNRSRFVGVLAEDAPELMMDSGQSFSPVSAVGYLIRAVQQLAERIEALEARP
jgi:hypothetical protein